jgi:hypothetical protein
MLCFCLELRNSATDIVRELSDSPSYIYEIRVLVKLHTKKRAWPSTEGINGGRGALAQIFMYLIIHFCDTRILRASY